MNYGSAHSRAKLAVMLALAPLLLVRSLAPARAAEIDYVYNAYQRGYFLTAFGLATHRATENNDPKAMTMLGVLYANGEAVPQDDKKAAEWYKLAADRGD